MKFDTDKIIRALGLENLTQIFWKDEIQAYTTNKGKELEVKASNSPQAISVEVSTRQPYSVISASHINHPLGVDYYTLSPFKDNGIDAGMQGIIFAIQYFKIA